MWTEIMRNFTDEDSIGNVISARVSFRGVISLTMAYLPTVTTVAQMRKR